jgi:hypothetical protein
MTAPRKNFRRRVCFPPIDLTEILVRWDEAVTATIGPVSPETIERLRERDFDQAPVLNADGRVLGMILTSRLAELFCLGKHLAADDPELVHDTIPSDPGLDLLLQSMATKPVAIVETEYSDPVTGRSHVAWHGFITLSDLNKHPVRAQIYPVLAELEAGLGKIVARHFTDSQDWLSRLDAKSRKRLNCYWEQSKKDNIDIGPIAGANLSDLYQIVAGDTDLLRLLGFPCQNEWEKCTDGIVRLRNAVMHPVRPLFSRHADLASVRELLEQTLDLVNRVRELVSHAAGPR